MKILRICFFAIITLIASTPLIFANEEQGAKVDDVYQENTVVAYFDKEGRAVDNKEQSTYYRKVIKNKGNNSYIIQDFYTKSDKKQIDPVLFTNIKNMKSFISDEIGEKEGIYIQWYENGQKEFETFYKNDVPVHGEKSWYPNGQLKSEIHVVDGKFSGPQKTWYENGKPQYYFEITDTKRDKSKLIEWYENGNKKLEQSFHGQSYSSIEWYENGHKKSEGKHSREGKKQDVYKEWYPNGQLQSDCKYENNKLSSCKLWNEEGQLVSE